MRIRTVKPEFFLHERLFELERETSFPMRVAFAGIWCACDRAGRFKWEPRRLGVSILPYDDIDFSRVLDALLTRGFLVKYRVGDEWFGCIPSWGKHQFVNPRELKSEIPDVSLADEVDASGTRASRVSDASRKEGKGKEGKGKEYIAPADADAEAKIPRERNVLMDALASVDGSDPLQVTKSSWGAIGKALSEIKAACPNVTTEEIKRRAGNYRTNMRGATITATALAKHWAPCDSAAEFFDKNERVMSWNRP